MSSMKRLLIFGLFLLPGLLNADIIKVGTIDFPPSVMVEEDHVSGFDIMLWELIALELDLEYEYVVVEDFDIMFDQLQEGVFDVMVAGISITEEREKFVDFSHPYFNSGLSIMIPAQSRDSKYLWRSILQFKAIRAFFSSLSSPIFLELLITLILIILTAAHIIWFIERGKKRDLKGAIRRKYRHGIFDSIYFVVVTFSTEGYGDITPRKHMGRAFNMLLIILGVTFFSNFTARLSANYTADYFEYHITSPDDLYNRRVGTEEMTSAIEPLKDYGARVVTYPNIYDAYDALQRGEIEAVVYDTPSVLYYVNNFGEGQVRVLPDILEEQYYSIVFREDDPLLEEINTALLNIQEDGRYERIYSLWFKN